AASTFSASLHALDEVNEEFEPERQTSLTKLTPAERLRRIEWSRQISIRDVCFRYPSSPRNVIDHVDLVIPKNTSVAFIGSTGCGKSTLVDLILGLHTPSSGGIYVDDVRLTKDNQRNWRAG